MHLGVADDIGAVVFEILVVNGADGEFESVFVTEIFLYGVTDIPLRRRERERPVFSCFRRIVDTMVFVEYDPDACVFAREYPLSFSPLRLERSHGSVESAIFQRIIFPVDPALVIERDERSEIHEGGVYRPSGNPGIPEPFLYLVFFRSRDFPEAISMVVPREYLFEIGIEAQKRFVVGEGSDGGRGIWPYPGKI